MLPAATDRRVAEGLALGFAAAAMWASYFVYARAGVVAGLQAQDIVLLRIGVAGTLMAAWLGWRGRAALLGLGGIGWRRGAALAVCVGPGFIMLGSGGYHFAPLSHGAVLQPATVTLVGIALSVVVLGERAGARRLWGAALVLAGLALIAAARGGATGPQAWIGDLMFVGAGLMWSVFTVLLRLWRLPGLEATAALSIVSALVAVPAFFALDSVDRIAALPPAALAVQVVVQGVLAGILALAAFGAAVARLGAARGAMFGAAVPVIALAMGMPLAGEVPLAQEALGALVVTAGLAMALSAAPTAPGSPLA
ncbi:MAG: DMT family transporter [Pseudomonadota bacterium]